MNVLPENDGSISCSSPDRRPSGDAGTSMNWRIKPLADVFAASERKPLHARSARSS
jgi:hypothetical protein